MVAGKENCAYRIVVTDAAFFLPDLYFTFWIRGLYLSVNNHSFFKLLILLEDMGGHLSIWVKVHNVFTDWLQQIHLSFLNWSLKYLIFGFVWDSESYNDI